MNKATLVILTVLVAATGITGYLTKSKIDELQRNLGTAKSEIAVMRKGLDDTKLTLNKAVVDLQAANQAKNERTTQLDAVTKEREEIAKQVEEQKALVKDRDEKLAKYANMPPAVKDAATAAELQKQLAALIAERDSLVAQINEGKQREEIAAKRATTAEQQLTATSEKIRHYEQNVARLGVTGRVLAVNAGWNFMVVSVGDKDGAAPNAAVVVSRNGQHIARGKITTVEPGRSVANILPESLTRGQSVQPGDQVIFTRL